MRRLVLDASVVLKWFLPVEAPEPDVDQALLLLQQVKDGEILLVQPPHWLAEVGAVLARLAPDRADMAIRLLQAMELPEQNEADLYTVAVALAIRLDHRLFDTLYHAVALSGHADVLVTADLRYVRKARTLGAIMPLAKWR